MYLIDYCMDTPNKSSKPKAELFYTDTVLSCCLYKLWCFCLTVTCRDCEQWSYCGLLMHFNVIQWSSIRSRLLIYRIIHELSFIINLNEISFGNVIKQVYNDEIHIFSGNEFYKSLFLDIQQALNSFHCGTFKWTRTYDSAAGTLSRGSLHVLSAVISQVSCKDNS